MSSLMVHLLTARKYNPSSSVAFYIGNIAPDTVSDRQEKDRSHFRDRSDRLSALNDLALSMNLSDDFSKGILLHLYLDYKWDSYPMHDFIENYRGDNWFPAYRHEIAIAGAWLYHHTNWSKSVWDEMASYPPSKYKNVNGIRVEKIPDLIKINRTWHADNNIGPSSAFPPDFIEEFTSKVAIDFKKWLEVITHRFR